MIALLVLSSGCAFGNRHVTLTYQPTSVKMESRRDVTVYVAPFTDKRLQPRLVGHVLNGFGMKTAKVLAENDVAIWIRNALIGELQASGYNVVEAPATPLALTGDIINIKCDSYFTYEGVMHLSVQLKRGDETVFNQLYTGEDSLGLNWAMTARSYGAVLEAALRAAVLQIINDVNRAVESEPG